MLYTNKQNTYNLSFGSRNKLIRDADKICRKVNLEFPVISSTRLDNFKNIEKPQFLDFQNATAKLVLLLRTYYEDLTRFGQQLKILYGMKTIKAANCAELSEATSLAMRLNGYNNARNFWLYAINTKTNKLRDLDHTVTAINFEIPESYLTKNIPSQVKRKHLLKSNNQAIIIDSWSGFADYAKNAIIRYRNDIKLSTKVKNNEKILFLPLPITSLKPTEIEFLKYKYPGLLLKSHKPKITQSERKKYESITEDASIEHMVNLIKKQYNLKGAVENRYFEKYSITNIARISKNSFRNFWEKLKNMFFYEEY